MNKKAEFAIIATWIALIVLFAIEFYRYAFAGGLGIKDAFFMLGEDAQETILGFGFASILLFIFLYALRPLIFFPASVATITSVFLFGATTGFFVSYTGEMVSASIAFFAGKYFGNKLGLTAKINKTSVGSYLQGNPFMSVLFLRLVPIFPFDVVSYASGIMRLPLKGYAFGTLLGVLPGLSAYIFLGFSLMHTEYIATAIMIFALLTSLSYIAKKRASKRT